MNEVCLIYEKASVQTYLPGSCAHEYRRLGHQLYCPSCRLSTVESANSVAQAKVVHPAGRQWVITRHKNNNMPA